jgi:hypothetical protein
MMDRNSKQRKLVNISQKLIRPKVYTKLFNFTMKLENVS